VGVWSRQNRLFWTRGLSLLTGGLLLLSADSLPALTVGLEPIDSETAPSVSGDAHLCTEVVKKELTSVIEGQLAAFRAGDFARAYTFAASEIRGMFPVGVFETMVKNGYPLIAHSTTAHFGLAFDTGNEAVVTVRVIAADDTSIEYQYMLKKESSGWKIAGVFEVKAEGLKV